MQNFSYDVPASPDAAIAAAASQGSMYIAGGTDLMQLMKDNISAPTRIVDIASLNLTGIEADNQHLRLTALERMSDVADHAGVKANFPVISQALLASASPQLRNMGTMGGNMLQRTRCGYFRDTGSACNKRVPGSGCPAIPGRNRMLGILGTSESCIATHPSDLAVALAALDANVELRGANAARRIVKLADFHLLPGATPQHETVLQPGELITALTVQGAAPVSSYLKVRDRASFEFAVVSVAVTLELQSGRITRARLAAGGVAPKPWRLAAVETALAGQTTADATLQSAAAHAADDAIPRSENAFKVKLLQNAVFRALKTTIAGSAT
jgi:xanthine dehydrogenase YagS FAD-binding subunit